MKTTEIHETVMIPALPDEVYKGFVDGETHAKMTGAGASSDNKVDGEYTAWDGYIFGKYLELEPVKRILAEWQTTEWPEGYPPSKLELLFKEKDGQTELTMNHTEAPEEQVDDYKQGWEDYYWVPMKEYFSSNK